MGAPATTGLTLGGAAAGGALSYEIAQRNNQALRTNIRQTRLAGADTIEQIREQAALARQQRVAELQRLTGRIRATRSGVLSSASLAQFERQAAIDADTEIDAIARNELRQRRAVLADVVARSQGLATGLTNPLLSGISGGLSGASTGLNIAGAGREYQALRELS